MEYNYYGTINRKTLSKLTKKEQNEYLSDKDLLVKSYFIPINLKNDETVPGHISGSSPVIFENFKYECSSILADCIYDYILEKYGAYIKYDVEIFKLDFNDKSFGLTSNEVRKIALNQFNTIYDTLIPFETARLEDRFKVLSRERDYFKKEIINHRNILFAYLYGEETYFSVSTYKASKYLQDIIDYQSKLEILLGLNKVHEFQKDNYFSNSNILYNIYDKFQHLFKTYYGFAFTHYLIGELNYFKPTEIESLYEMLVSQKLMTNSKSDFITYLLSTHNITTKKIRDYSKKGNQKHEQRVKELIKKWDKFPKND